MDSRQKLNFISSFLRFLDRIWEEKVSSNSKCGFSSSTEKYPASKLVKRNNLWKDNARWCFRDLTFTDKSHKLRI